ncbi:MAG: hypothetical protein ABW092_01760, partial [Candidatus Thiodiazotropha sp.]
MRIGNSVTLETGFEAGFDCAVVDAGEPLPLLFAAGLFFFAACFFNVDGRFFCFVLLVVGLFETDLICFFLTVPRCSPVGLALATGFTGFTLFPELPSDFA